MGGCLIRDKLIEEEIIQQTQISEGFQMDEIEDVKDLASLKDCDILQITQLYDKIIVLKRYSDNTPNLKVIEIVGNGNMMYLEIHKQLQQCENYFLGSLMVREKCYLIFQKIYGLAAQVSIQEMQCLCNEDNLTQTITNRYEEKFMCVGAIYIFELVILVFRQMFVKVKCPIVQKFENQSFDTLCLITFQKEVYEIKRQL